MPAVTGTAADAPAGSSTTWSPTVTDAGAVPRLCRCSTGDGPSAIVTCARSESTGAEANQAKSLGASAPASAVPAAVARTDATAGIEVVTRTVYAPSWSGASNPSSGTSMARPASKSKSRAVPVAAPSSANTASVAVTVPSPGANRRITGDTSR